MAPNKRHWTAGLIQAAPQGGALVGWSRCCDDASMQDEAGWHGGRRRLVSLLIVLAAVVFLAVAVWVLPAYLAPRSAFDNDGDAVRAQNDARGMMLQGLGGARACLTKAAW